MDISVIILAAGHGTRMNSKLPKILHPLAGVPMIERIVNAAKKLNPDEIYVVYGAGLEPHLNQLTYLQANWVEQKKQLGTGHAVLQAIPKIPDQHQVLILYGDIPLISTKTLELLLSNINNSKVGLLVTTLDDPHGFGRIIRGKNNNIIQIIEDKDTDKQQYQIKEINTGIITAPAGKLKAWLPKLNKNNVQEEYYLTDIVEIAVSEGCPVKGIQVEDFHEVQGVNNLYQLGKLERYYQYHQAEKLMRQGVMIMDPTRFDLRGELDTGTDVIIDINVVFEGKIKIGNNCKIKPNVILRNVIIGNNVIIKANSLIEDSIIGDNCEVGPFARLRPGNTLEKDVHIGNFVEIKKSKIGKGTKAAHLTYIGDASVGEYVNFGAGSVICNYDGSKKHNTHIGNHCFIGSGTQLIAPINVGNGAYIGAGSTINEDAPANKLTLARQRQITIQDWHPPEKVKE